MTVSTTLARRGPSSPASVNLTTSPPKSDIETLGIVALHSKTAVIGPLPTPPVVVRIGTHNVVGSSKTLPHASGSGPTTNTASDLPPTPGPGTGINGVVRVIRPLEVIASVTPTHHSKKKKWSPGGPFPSTWPKSCHSR